MQFESSKRIYVRMDQRRNPSRYSALKLFIPFLRRIYSISSVFARFKGRYAAAMECLEKDLEECIQYLKLPEEHRMRLRTTNILEILLGVRGRRRVEPPPMDCFHRLCRLTSQPWTKH